MEVDISYMRKLEETIDELEDTIERFKATYKVLALACAKGSMQVKLIDNNAHWNDEWISQPQWSARKVMHTANAESKKNLYKRMTEANVAHLRRANTKGGTKIMTELGPPPTTKLAKSYIGMTYYVY